MRKALIVATNVERFGTLDRATGLWLSEAAHFQNVLEDAGIAVDYVSPDGGYIPLDPNSLAGVTFDKGCWREYGNAHYRNEILGKSRKPADIHADEYSVIYFAGGHGAVWDFPDNAALGKIARDIYDNGGVISSVCHGAAGLLSIKNDDGTPFIQGRTVTGFSNAEEQANGTMDAVPYATEDALKQAGAHYTEGAIFTEHVVVDGRLITGQNPQSAAGVGRAVVEQLQSTKA